MNKIKIVYESIDYYSEEKEFTSLEYAKEYAQRWVGEHPEISPTFGYAYSPDGVGRISCEGCSIHDLFK